MSRRAGEPRGSTFLGLPRAVNIEHLHGQPFPVAARAAVADTQLRRNLGNATATIRAKRARVVYFAGLPKHDPVSPLDMNQLHYKELAILGAYGATHRQYRITMDYLNRRRKELAPVVTHQFPLDRIDEAFETIRSGSGLKTVVVP